jgi:NADH-quinone oxidoreductase subunit G
VADGGRVTVSTEAGALTLPVLVTEMPDRVVWVPTNAADSQVRDTLHAGAGDVVRLARADETATEKLDDKEVTA